MVPKTVLTRAYSLFDIKAIDEEQRLIEGIASTPNTDRQDDIMESEGGVFTLPMPFLWQHGKDAFVGNTPVGHVIAASPSPKGVPVRIQMARSDEPGRLKEILDFAWQAVKQRLVRGFSIGFRPLEQPEPIKGSFGLRYKKWEWLELSAVTIPANADAAIHTIKSLAEADTAALGTGQSSVPRPSAGVSAPVVKVQKGTRTMAKTITEQIAAFRDTRRAKATERTDIMTKAGDEGVTLDAAQKETYDTLTSEIKEIDEHISRLEVLEAENKAAAVAVNGGSAAAAAASRGGTVIQVKDNLPPGIEFARYAMCLAAARGNTVQALEIAKMRYPDQPRIQTVLKAAVGAGTTVDGSWAGTLVDYTNFTGDFVEYLRPQTILGKFGTNGIPSLTRIPFNVRIQSQTSGGTGYWVGQGQAKPLESFDFAPITLTWAKVANIAVLTDELVRFSSPSAEMLVRNALAGALIARLDTDFVDPTKAAVANVSPASITNGLTAIQTAGSSEADVRIDVVALFAPFIAANITLSNGVWIMSTTTALNLSLMANALGQPAFPGITMRGGTFIGLPVIVSDYVGGIGSPTNNLVVLLNASDIYLADDGQVVIDVSREASLQMDNAPTNATTATGSPLAPTATTLVSLWQTNSIGLRAERYINWAKRRTAAVAYMDNCIWGSGGGSPA